MLIDKDNFDILNNLYNEKVYFIAVGFCPVCQLY